MPVNKPSAPPETEEKIITRHQEINIESPEKSRKKTESQPKETLTKPKAREKEPQNEDHIEIKTKGQAEELITKPKTKREDPSANKNKVPYWYFKK